MIRHFSRRIATKLFREIETQDQQRVRDSLRQDPEVNRGYRKPLFFLFLVIFVPILVLLSYAFTLSKTIFGSLILARGFQIVDTSFFRMLDDIANTLSRVLRLDFLSYLLSPIIDLFRVLSFIRIDLSTVSVTCAGSQAPIELLIDCLILGTVSFLENI